MLKLTNIFQELLNEAVYEYGAIMLYFPVPKDFWGKIQDRISDDELASEKDENGDEKKGRQPVSDCHITLLYGVHEDVKDSEVEEILKDVAPIEVTLKKISAFENEDVDVLKFDVEGKELNQWNKKLKKLPHTNKYKEFHPHLTIAYLKKGCLDDDKQKDLSDDEALTVKANKIVYSKPSGDKKEFKLS